MTAGPKATVRDAALRKLARINRWLIAGSVALTGVLSEVAAQAFPGKTIQTPKAAKKSSVARGQHRSDSSGSAKTSSGSLHPPAQAPRAAPESAPAQEPKPAHESAPAQESARAKKSAPAKESAPAQESAPPTESAPAPAQESVPAQESSAPVVSGGS